MEDVAGDGIERAEGFVHQEDVRVLCEGARQSDTLTHAPGELVRALVREAPEVDELEELAGPSLAGTAADAAEPQRKLDVPGSSQPWEEGRLLEHECRAAGHLDLAARRVVEAGDQVEQRRLAAP